MLLVSPPLQHFFFLAHNINHMDIYKDDIYREISRVHRAMGVKMGHAALLIHRHGTDTLAGATMRRYNLTEARNTIVHFLTHEVQLQDLWVVFLAHYYKANGVPDPHMRAQLAMSTYTAAT